MKYFKSVLYMVSGCLLYSNMVSAAPENTFLVGDQEAGKVYATLIPINQAIVASEISARIKTINFRPGQRFMKGDTLVAFDCKAAEIERGRLSAKLRGAEVRLESMAKLRELDSASNLEYGEALSKQEQAKAELEHVQYKIDNCIIKAPYPGEVIRLNINQDEFVQEGDPLLHIIENQNLEVQIYVPSKWLRWLKVGSGFTLSLEERNEPYQGHVEKIVSNVDSASQSVLVYGKIDTNGDLLPGMSGIAHFAIQKLKNNNQE